MVGTCLEFSLLKGDIRVKDNYLASCQMEELLPGIAKGAFAMALYCLFVAVVEGTIVITAVTMLVVRDLGNLPEDWDLIILDEDQDLIILDTINLEAYQKGWVVNQVDTDFNYTLFSFMQEPFTVVYCLVFVASREVEFEIN